MKILLSLLALVLCPQEPVEDVIHLKNGQTKKGIILSEDDEKIVLEILIRNRKGKTVGSGKQTIKKADILRIERASEEAKKETLEKSKAFEEREERLRAAMEKLRPEPAEFKNRKGLLVRGTHFEVYSTCEEDFVREVALALEQVFDAYKGFFGVRRNQDKRVVVYLLEDAPEYFAFQKEEFGGALANPAFYHMELNYVAAFNRVPKREIREAKDILLELETQLVERKRNIRKFESALKKEVREVRSEILAEAKRLRREIKKEKDKEKRENLDKELDEWKKGQLDTLDRLEEQYTGYLKNERSAAGDIIEKSKKVRRDLSKRLQEENRTMFETLYHEGFHAFLTNYLWEQSADREFPRWLNEGMATYFDMSAVDAGRLVHGATHLGLLALLQKKDRENALEPWTRILTGGPELFAVTHLKDVERSTTAYAQSWILAHYLAKNRTRKDLETFVSAVLSGTDDVKAFEAMVGMKLADFEKEIGVYLRKLR